MLRAARNMVWILLNGRKIFPGNNLSEKEKLLKWNTLRKFWSLFSKKNIKNQFSLNLRNRMVTKIKEKASSSLFSKNLISKNSNLPIMSRTFLTQRVFSPEQFSTSVSSAAFANLFSKGLSQLTEITVRSPGGKSQTK